jgi:hypothetical protein
MEHRTLKTEAEMIKDVQTFLNDIDTKLGFELNYETLLKLYLVMKRLKTIRPRWIFRVVRNSPIEENTFLKTGK